MTTLERQDEVQRSIEAMLINFKKDGADRKKEAEYFKKRSERLTGLWGEFQYNHNQLSRTESQSHPYFTNGMFEKTKQKYLELNAALNEGYQILTAKKLSEEQSMRYPKATEVLTSDDDGEATEESTSQGVTREVQQQKREKGTSSKYEEMLRKQYINIKAFVRTVNNIDIDTLNEKWELDDALKTLHTRWTVIDTQHWEIESEATLSDLTYEKTFNKHEKTFNELKKAINKKMWSVVHREKSTPTLDIPSFHGNYNAWIPFKDLFGEVIHNNNTISNAQKMQFLKSKVKGEAERLIQHLQISSDNYTVCWEILNNRYNNKKLIFTSHINLIFALPIMQQQSLVQIKRMYDTTTECLHAIRNLGVETSTWDPILVHILSQKLDPETHMDYIESLKNPRELPVLQELLDYLEGKFTSLEASRRKQEPVNSKTFSQYPSTSNARKPFYSNNIHLNSNNNYQNNNGVNKQFKGSPPAKSMHVSSYICPLCKNSHGIYNCRQFLKMPVEKRFNAVNKLALCINCLFSHHGNSCSSTKTCHKCAGPHNTLLHEACAKTNPQSSTSASSAVITSNKSNEHVTYVSQGSRGSQILLATALLKVKAADGSHHVLRALIDQGSQISIITEKAAQTLKLRRETCKGVIYGVGEKENKAKGQLNISCTAMYSDFNFNAKVIIMNNLIKSLPNQTFSKPSWSVIQNINLADPEFYVSRPVDLLLGADIYANIILNGVIKGEDDLQPMAQQTHLGWLLCGNAQTLHCNVVINDLEDIQQFWEVEDITEQGDLSRGDLECMNHYQNNTYRNTDGSYTVRLPMKQGFEKMLGESKTKAIAQFQNMERKLARQNNLAQAYKAFMKEYSDLEHMKLSTNNLQTECYLPHHGVERVESTTTKYRVVFNASSTTTTGYSLNDLMYTGPNLQQDLQTLLLNWRQYEFAFTADIEKMYRQILVHENDRPLQKIIWRENPEQPLQSFELSTVTYGTKAAPFLAMMTLRRLAADERERYPEAAKVLEESFYMDDLVHGAHSVEQGKRLISDLNKLLKSGGFNLRKWATNDERMLEDINIRTTNDVTTFNFKTENISKTLGLCWNPNDDTFTFKHSNEQLPPKTTKRALLSEMSKLFDPLGWLAPLTTKLKILFQMVWKENTHWDEKVSDNIYDEWVKIRADIGRIKEYRIPRWIRNKENDVIELHGFCDASLNAFSCVVYAQNKGVVTLVAAKTKLVPHNKIITIPRLELSGAHLLAKLMKKIKHSFNKYRITTFGWTDSKILLGWLQGEQNRWKPFVANRVEQIKEIMPAEQWFYVKTTENPADAASRGLTASQLKEHSLWWTGPSWLPTFQPTLPRSTYNTNEEEKAFRTTYVLQNINYDQYIINNLLERHSSITKVTRVLAWILRALTRTRSALPKFLTLQEIQKAKLTIIKHVQRSEFAADIECLQNQRNIDSKSKLLQLKPFVDENGILRVGGRLREAYIPFEMKHPKIIPKDSRLTTLLIDQAHLQTLHGGASLTTNKLREEFWIIGGNNRVKNQVRKCVKCVKVEAKKQQQLMGDLPSARVNEASPFFHTGIDYTGFVDIKASKGRGSRILKGYIAIFICMVTKAVHLELVTELTSSAFLAALRRMAARKGTPRHIYSDNGTNFVGANRILREQWEQLRQVMNDSFLSEVTDMEIEWHFNAPSWPSAGGLWERAVRSLKYHLKRVINEQKLTYEEFATVLAQIEACLNSRPLCPLTESVDNLDVLTPAHFLTGRSGLTVIETEEDARTRWHLTQKIFNDIWKRWKLEYLTQLTARQKWRSPQKNVEKGDVVIIHDDNVPAGKWPLGRVIEVHPGQDGYVRVVTVKTKNGTIKRPVIKLSVLPLGKPNQNEQAKQKPKPQKRGCLATSFIMVLYFLSFITTGLCTKITAIDNGQGLYFDKMGNMQLIRDEWKLIAFYDMRSYWEGTTAYEKYNFQLEKICEQVITLTHCNVILLQLRHSYFELQHYNNILIDNKMKHETRVRRGLINGVGYLANSLFGVLDEQFAEQYQRDINLIRQNEKHLGALWKNQTSIIEAEHNLLKRTEESFQKQHKIIHQHLIKLEQSVTSMNKELTNAERMAQFTIVAMATNNLLSQLKTIQDTLLETITNIYNGRINIHVIDPQQLQQELNIISGHLITDVTLPIENVATELHNIYHLLKIKARITNNYMIMEIRIPLISRDRYDLYNAIPIPYTVANHMSSIIPIETHIAINLQKDAYIPISENNLEHCIIRDSSTYLCYLKTPIYKFQNNNNLCVRDETQNHKCKITTTACQNRWINLKKNNQYLYFCCQECQFRTLCKDQVTAKILTNTNIINIEESCVVKTDNFTIHSHKHRESQIKIAIDISAPTIDPINHILNITIPDDHSYMNINSSNTKQFNQLEERIRIMSEEKPLLDSYSAHDVHHYASIYSLWGVAVIALLLFFYYKTTWWRCQPKAAPTTRKGSGEEAAVPDAATDAGPRARAGAAPAPPRAGTSHKCSANSVVKVRECSASENEVCVSIDRGSSPIFRKIEFD